MVGHTQSQKEEEKQHMSLPDLHVLVVCVGMPSAFKHGHDVTAFVLHYVDEGAEGDQRDGDSQLTRGVTTNKVKVILSKLRVEYGNLTQSDSTFQANKCRF